MTSFPRPVLLSLLTAWVAVVGASTLLPSGYASPLTLERFLCVGCGSRGSADIILNWMLFVPGGALAAIVLGQRRAVIMALSFSAVIETLQIGIPGRYPGLQDLVFNTLGALSGALLAGRGLGRQGQRLLVLLVVVAWLSPVVLLIPLGTSDDLYGMWTPVRNAVRYEGEILDASVGGLPIPPSGIVPNRTAVDSALFERRPVEILLEVGPPPSTFVTVVQIVEGGIAVVAIGALGEDLILRGKTPARMLGFDQPDARWPGAMAGVSAGDTVKVVIDRSRNSVCMSVREATECGLAPSLGDGWGHLVHLEGASRWLRALMSIGWSAGLGLLLGTASATARNALISGVGLAATGLVACILSPDVRPELLHGALLLGGSLFGARIRLLTDRRGPLGRGDIWASPVA